MNVEATLNIVMAFPKSKVDTMPNITNECWWSTLAVH